jgi:DNA-binding NarL/FixJ family response regulator
VSTVRVVVVEDHPLYRDAVVSLTAGLAGFEVIGAYGDAESALAVAGAHPPDVVVLDLALPGIDGISALGRFRALEPEPSVLVLTMSEDPAVLAAAVRAGARGYVVKGAEPEDIALALQAVARGQAVFGAQVANAVLAQASSRSAGPGAAFPGLTTRELDVLDLLSRGRSNDEIAAVLFLSPKTVRNHVSTVLGKLGVSTRAEAVARARDGGLGAE